MSKIINENLREKFIERYMSGMRMTDIAKDLGIDRSTVYTWRDREDIKTEIELRRKEIADAGQEFIKSKYLEYLNNISKLCNNFDDKRTTLASNIFMVEKLDGKNVAKVEVDSNINSNVEVIDFDAEIDSLEIE